MALTVRAINLLRPRRWHLPLVAFVLTSALFATAAQAARRNMAERAAFVRHNPCPETGLRRGACPGWEVDHAHALCAGGPDARTNMQWLTVQAHREKTRHDRRLCRALKNIVK